MDRELFSQESEQGVLGAILIKPELASVIADELEPDDFFFAYNRIVFKQLKAMAAKREPIDAITVGEKIGDLHDYGSAIAYCVELHRNTPSAANAKTYAGIVKQRSVERQLERIGAEITDLASDDLDTDSKIARAQDLVSGVIYSTGEDDFIGGADLVAEHAHVLERRSELENGIDGLTTGIPELDKQLGGLKAGGLYVIAGRPKMGKTTLAGNITDHVGISLQKPVAVFSMEMQNTDLTDNSLASLGYIYRGLLKDGTAADKEPKKLAAAARLLSSTKAVYYKRRTISLNQLVSASRRQYYRGGLSMIVADHVGLISVDDAKINSNSVARVSEITRRLKLLAMELGIPVILLSQLNRSLEHRPDKRPIPSDLRDSGSIEQDADAVLFVYRDEVYFSDTPDRGVIELIVGLSRHTEAGTVRARYMGGFSLIKSLDGYVPPAPSGLPPERRALKPLLED